MSEIKLYDFQEEVVNCKEKTIICNWCRNASKTFTLAMTIAFNQPKNVVYISNYKEDMLFENIERFTTYKVKFKDNSKVIYEVRTTRETKEIAIYRNYNSLDKNITYDYILFDEMLPFNIGVNGKQIISTISYNNYNEWIQRWFPKAKLFQKDYRDIVNFKLLKEEYVLECRDIDKIKFCNEYAILDNPYEENKTTEKDINNNFLEKQLSKLENELDSICQSKDNILTRKNLLEMILSIHRELNGQPVIGVDLQKVSDLVMNKLSDELKKSGIRR